MQLKEMSRTVLSTVWLLLVIMVRTAFSLTEGTPDGFTMETTTVIASTTPKSTPGPDDLVLVDWIIISVTCFAALCIMIGVTWYAIKAHLANSKEKEMIYNRYLDRDELAGIKEGVENDGYSAGY